MNIFRAIARAFIGDPGEPLLLDHVPTSALEDWRERKLADAAKKLGRPFKCAANGLPRETLVDGKYVEAATVTPIRERK